MALKDRGGKRVVDPLLFAKERRLSLADQVSVLNAKVVGLEKELVAVRLGLPSEASMTALIEHVYAKEQGELEKTRTDVVKILRGLVLKGLVTQDELNHMV